MSTGESCLVRLNRSHWRAILRDWVVECLALQPLRIKLWEYRHLRRFLLAALFRLEKDRIVVTGAGPAGHRYRMCLSWQGHTECVLGIYEPGVIRALQKYLHPADTCLDVGSHVGYMAIFMARLVGPKGCVVAFEPVPGTFQALKENIEMNHLQNVRLECAALGEHEGTISLLCDAAQELSWTSSITAYSVPGSNLTEISAPVQPLDAYLQQTGLRPGLVKIDVEGAELAVLRGALQMLREIRPVILVEIHDLGAAHQAGVLGLLHSCDYAVEEMARRGREIFCLAVPRRADSA